MSVCMCAFSRWDETMRFAIWTLAVVLLLAAAVAGAAAPALPDEAAAPAAPGAARDDLVFRGTVTTLQPAPVAGSNAGWIVTLHVQQVRAGKFSGDEFSFRVHSPAQSGLRPGETYTVRATATGDGYRVDPRQWLDQTPQRRAILATPSGNVSITALDLEQIRDVAADLLQTSTNPNYGKEWADDLRASDGDIDSTGVARIGRWILESRHGRLVLVRHPVRSAIMHFVLIDVALRDGRWQATGMGDERMEMLVPAGER